MIFENYSVYNRKRMPLSIALPPSPEISAVKFGVYFFDLKNS